MVSLTKLSKGYKTTVYNYAQNTISIIIHKNIISFLTVYKMYIIIHRISKNEALNVYNDIKDHKYNMLIQK